MVVGQRRGGTWTRGRGGGGQPLHPCVFVSFRSGAQGPHHGNGLQRAAGTEDVGTEESVTVRRREATGGAGRGISPSPDSAASFQVPGTNRARAGRTEGARKGPGRDPDCDPRAGPETLRPAEWEAEAPEPGAGLGRGRAVCRARRQRVRAPRTAPGPRVPPTRGPWLCVLSLQRTPPSLLPPGERAACARGGSRISLPQVSPLLLQPQFPRAF